MRCVQMSSKILRFIIKERVLNNMILIKKTSIRKLREDWIRLNENSNGKVSPFQEFEFAEILNSYHFLFTIVHGQIPTFMNSLKIIK